MFLFSWKPYILKQILVQQRTTQNLYTLVQLQSDVTSLNSVFVSDKIFKSSDNLDLTVNKCNFMCSLFSVFALFCLILENVKTIERKFSFSLLYLTLVTWCQVVLCQYLIIYLYILGYMNFPAAEMAFSSSDNTIIANFPTLIIKILFYHKNNRFHQNVIFLR